MISRLLPIFALLLAIGLFLGYINPTYTNDIEATKQKIASLDSALAAADQFQQKEAQLTSERAAIPADKLARLEAFLPDSVDNIQLILDLDALAARSGVTLSNFDIGSSDASGKSAAASTGTSVAAGSMPAAAGTSAGSPATAPGMGASSGNLSLTPQSPLDSLDITLTATGSYAAFRTFLVGIEQSLRPLDIVSVAVHDSDTGVYTYDLTIRIYWLR